MSDPSKRLRRRRCREKRRFYSEKDARLAAERLTRDTSEFINYYRCYMGDDTHWHVGHPKNDAYFELDHALEISKKRYG